MLSSRCGGCRQKPFGDGSGVRRTSSEFNVPSPRSSKLAFGALLVRGASSRRKRHRLAVAIRAPCNPTSYTERGVRLWRGLMSYDQAKRCISPCRRIRPVDSQGESLATCPSSSQRSSSWSSISDRDGAPELPFPIDATDSRRVIE